MGFGMLQSRYSHGKGPTCVLNALLPDFCWQTLQEILLMVEQNNIETTISYESLRATISDLVRKGKILKRPFVSLQPPKGTQMHARCEYIRNPKWSRKCPKKR